MGRSALLSLPAPKVILISPPPLPRFFFIIFIFFFLNIIGGVPIGAVHCRPRLSVAAKNPLTTQVIVGYHVYPQLRPALCLRNLQKSAPLQLTSSRLDRPRDPAGSIHRRVRERSRGG
ncbi:hypothetical protein BDV59DRAFT_167592 [Aspergillus ambiguus]|uniref:uncharacterized protein n=1 Tax=Aspergillus ambiguus TaxID=176160 RepID=UPI003CCE01CE